MGYISLLYKNGKLYFEFFRNPNKRFNYNNIYKLKFDRLLIKGLYVRIRQKNK